VALRKAGLAIEIVRNQRVPVSRVSALDRTEHTLFLPRHRRLQDQSLRLGAVTGWD
jgi:hypothetical protein